MDTLALSAYKSNTYIYLDAKKFKQQTHPRARAHTHTQSLARAMKFANNENI